MEIEQAQPAHQAACKQQRLGVVTTESQSDL